MVLIIGHEETLRYLEKGVRSCLRIQSYLSNRTPNGVQAQECGRRRTLQVFVLACKQALQREQCGHQPYAALGGLLRQVQHQDLDKVFDAFPPQPPTPTWEISALWWCSQHQGIPDPCVQVVQRDCHSLAGQGSLFTLGTSNYFVV